MSNDEEFVIKTLKDSLNTYIEGTKITKILMTTGQGKILLNLIEKQQKEIEELQNEVMEQDLAITGLKENRRIAIEEIQEEYYVSKDKIKEKIEELNKKRIHYENDNTNKIFIREFTRKYTKKEDDDFGIFNIQEAITYMTNNEYLARIAELQELLEGDK